jgi:glycosyltransferase involved in cell wall biosynthesis
MTEPLVSIIVPVRNAGAELRGLLGALEQQTVARERFEVVIADDGSTDGSTAGLDTPDRWVRVLPGAPVSAYAARNRAVAASRGSILAFTDADCRPSPDWLANALARVDGAGVVAGLIRFELPERPSIWSLLDVDTFLDQERQVQAGVAVTANLVLRRELFDRIDGFDAELHAFADHDFVQRCVGAGAELVFADDAVVAHPTRDGRGQYLGKFWAMNRGYGEFAAERGERPHGVRPAAWVPIVSTLRTRLWYRRTLVGLDRHRFAVNGLRPRLADDLRAVPLIYLVLPYMACLAQLHGWRRRRAQVA